MRRTVKVCQVQDGSAGGRDKKGDPKKKAGVLGGGKPEICRQTFHLLEWKLET